MKNAHARNYVRPLSRGGFNCQGVPLGLVNYMNLNRSRRLPKAPVVHTDLMGGLIPVLWDRLALTPMRSIVQPWWGATRGFFTIYADSWRRY